MKKLTIVAALALVLALAAALASAALPAPVYASHCTGDERVMGTNYVLAEGQTLDRNLIVLGGNATVAEGAEVLCSVVVVGGDLTLAGTVAEDVVVFGGTARLESTARVEGELVTLGGTTQREEGAVVVGGESKGFGIIGRDDDDDNRWFRWRDRLPFVSPVLEWYRTVFNVVFSAVALGLLALLVVLFWPEQTARVSAAVTNAPAPSGGLGLLTLVAVPVLIALAAITICLIPVAFVGALVFGAATAFGWIALGMVVGTRLSVALNMQQVSPAVASALGTALLTLVARFVGEVPCVGWVVPLVLSAVGLGAVVLTRFGTQPYVPGPQPMPPAPPAPTVPPPAITEG